MQMAGQTQDKETTFSFFPFTPFLSTLPLGVI